MTIHKITVLIGSKPFETDTSGKFLDSFYIKTNNTALFKDAEQRTLLIEDDDKDFHDTLYKSISRLAHLTDFTGQTLVEDFNFGWSGDDSPSHVAPQGTALSWLAGHIIGDDNGNRFLAAFPLPNGEYSPRNTNRDSDGVYKIAKNDILGNRQAIMIIPLKKVDQSGNEILDENGELIFPVFDKAAVFHDLETFRQTEENTTFFEYLPNGDIKCFVQGSLIQTPHGLRAVETLQAGDIVLTHDNGPQPIIWVGNTVLDACHLDHAPNKWPVLIKKNALGSGIPDRELQVSPQHRILVKSLIAQRMFGQDENLVAAKHLLKMAGVETNKPKDGITYWHILLPQHDLVLSNGAWTESFFLGAYGLRTLAPEMRAELEGLFPKITQPDFKPRPARYMLTGREGRKLAERHAKNHKPLIYRDDQPYLRAFKEKTMSMA